MSDQDQIIERACIGDDQPHRLEAQTFEGLLFVMEILNGVVIEDVMGLEEAVDFIAGFETEQPPLIALVQVA